MGEVGTFSVYGVKLTEELLEAADLNEDLARSRFGGLAYRSGTLKEELAEAGVLLSTERATRRPAIWQQV